MLVVLAVGAGAASATVTKFPLLLFDRQVAESGSIVSIRSSDTPLGFAAADRRPPFGTPLRLYLVPKVVATAVRSPFDPRLHFVGVFVPDRLGRGVLTFAAPPLDSGEYAIAAWCRQCTYRPNFHVRRDLDGTILRLALPRPEGSCPVTRGRYGNGYLARIFSGDDGVVTARRDVDGALFQKFWWLPRRGFSGELAVRGERLDAPGSMRVLSVNWGHSSDGRGSWASAVEFPSEGCWRISGRVRDVALTYVVKVVAA